jgi:hypothetical protein
VAKSRNHIFVVVSFRFIGHSKIVFNIPTQPFEHLEQVIISDDGGVAIEKHFGVRACHGLVFRVLTLQFIPVRYQFTEVRNFLGYLLIRAFLFIQIQLGTSQHQEADQSAYHQ